MAVDDLIYRLEVDVVTVTNDIDGYQTPITSTVTSPTYSTKTLKFGLVGFHSMSNSGYENVLEGFNVNTPELKSGLGVASRSSATFTMVDFLGDPDEFSPAVVNDPTTIKRGTYFSKLNARHLIVNRPVRFYKILAGSGSVTEEYHFLSTDFKQISSDKWQLTCRDVLYRLEDKKTVFPKALSINVTNAPSTTGTTIDTNGLSSDWSQTGNVLCVGTEVLKIDSITGTNAISFGVTRQISYGIGSSPVRNYKNYQLADIRQGDSAFRGRRYDNANLADIIIDIFEDSGIDSSYYNSVDIQNTINDWVGAQSINCLFIEPKPSIEVLNNICQTFLIDIYADSTGQIQVTTTSPWQGTSVRFKEGREVTYGKGSIRISDDLRFSRALLSYAKKDMNEDNSYSASSFKFNSQYESSNFYGDEKLFTFENSDLLSYDIRSKEIAETTAIRFVNRWGFRPLVADLEINKTAFDQINIGDTVFIEHTQVQLPNGAIDTNRRYQVIKLQPLQNTFYKMKAVSFTPYFGTSDGFEYDSSTGAVTVAGAININDNKGINLYTESGSPPPASQLSEYTFVLDASVLGDALGNDNKAGSIELGEGWSSAIKFNIVCLNGITVTSTGGNGGSAGEYGKDGANGGSGGIVIINTSGTAHNVNIYLSGSRTVQGNIYSCDGYLSAPGGGGGGGAGGGAVGPSANGAGAGGAGFPSGVQGLSPTSSVTGATPATLTTGGDGEVSGISGGDGGDQGQSGQQGDNSAVASGGAGGIAGKALVKNGAIVTLYSSGGRFIQGSGDAPNSIIT